jgi:hypothetical protein
MMDDASFSRVTFFQEACMERKFSRSCRFHVAVVKGLERKAPQSVTCKDHSCCLM